MSISTKSTGSSSWCCSCTCDDVFAGDVVFLLVVGSGSSIVKRIWRTVFVFPFVDVHRSNKPRIIFLQIITLSGLRVFIFHKVIQSRLPIFWLVFLLSFKCLSI